MSENFLTIFSSAWTEQYEQDVFSILSMPEDGMFKLSFQKKYLDDAVWGLFERKEYEIGSRALIVFRSNADNPNNKKFCIPIRWVRIQAIEGIANGGWVIHFRIQGYPQFTSEYAENTNDLEGIERLADKTFTTLSDTKLSVISNNLDCVELGECDNNPENEHENWNAIVNRIACIPEYEKFQFIKCSKFYIQEVNLKTSVTEKKWCSMVNNCFVATERKPIYIDIEYFTKKYDSPKVFDVWVNENALTRINGYQVAVQSSYGTKKLGFQPQNVPDKTIAEIEISFRTKEDNKLLTELVFPIVIHKDRKYRIFKALIMGIGALLVALPGMMPEKTLMIYKVLSYIAGGMVLGCGGYMESKE